MRSNGWVQSADVHRDGRVPGDLDDERFIATWVELALAYAGEHGIGASSVGNSRRR